MPENDIKYAKQQHMNQIHYYFHYFKNLFLKLNDILNYFCFKGWCNIATLWHLITKKVWIYEEQVVISIPYHHVGLDLREFTQQYTLSTYLGTFDAKDSRVKPIDFKTLENLEGLLRYNNHFHHCHFIFKTDRGLKMMSYKKRMGFYITRLTGLEIKHQANLKRLHHKGYADTFYFGFQL
ncbi:MAG: hypothetical protein JWM20_450 [Patescibacteria group bacterium]|nr:hypothetical protein [Patescibacteria group bacterium]